MNTLYSFSLFGFSFSLGYIDINLFSIGKLVLEEDGTGEESVGSFIRATYSAEDGWELDAFWADLWQK